MANEKARRRQSLVFRASEHAKHKLQEERKRKEELESARGDIETRQKDRELVQFAEEQESEARRLSLQARICEHRKQAHIEEYRQMVEKDREISLMEDRREFFVQRRMNEQAARERERENLKREEEAHRLSQEYSF
jgi:hypothetical protein